jgi:hypothetical protein
MAICVGFDRTASRPPADGLPPATALALSIPLPVNRYAQMTLAGVATGIWARTMLALGAIAGGAEPAIGTLAFGLLAPGLLLDFVLLTVVYTPFRVFGWSGRGMSLQRSRW